MSDLFVMIQKVKAHKGSAITKINDPLNDKNWSVWRELMLSVLELCGVQDYTMGNIDKLSKDDEQESYDIWRFNDNYA